RTLTGTVCRTLRSGGPPTESGTFLDPATARITRCSSGPERTATLLYREIMTETNTPTMPYTAAANGISGEASTVPCKSLTLGFQAIFRSRETLTETAARTSRCGVRAMAFGIYYGVR